MDSDYVSFQTKIYPLLKQVEKDKSISVASIKLVDSVVSDFCSQLLETVNDCKNIDFDEFEEDSVFHNNKKLKKYVESVTHLNHAVFLLIDGQIMWDAINSAGVALWKFDNVRCSFVSDRWKSGLTFSPNQIWKYCCRQNYDEELEKRDVVYVTAIIQHIASVVLKKASEVSNEEDRAHISPLDICNAIQGDDELDELFHDQLQNSVDWELDEL